MSTADFLVELGTEELPPKALVKLRDAFATGVEKRLATAHLEHNEILTFATPRRLAVLVKDLQTQQPTQTIENKGPPIKLAFDNGGKPTKAAEAFAAKCGVSVDKLDKLSSDKGEWLFYKGEAAGKPASDLLADIVNASLAALPIPKRMRWGSSDVEFVRPVHWLVMLLDSEVIAAEVLGLKAGNQTFGHRFHAPNAIKLAKPGDYADALRKQGHVIAVFTERCLMIEEAAAKEAENLGGSAILDPDVVNEVTALVEWPIAITGSFDEKFLRLPREVLIYTLQEHQRYFPVEKDG